MENRYATTSTQQLFLFRTTAAKNFLRNFRKKKLLKKLTQKLFFFLNVKKKKLVICNAGKLTHFQFLPNFKFLTYFPQKKALATLANMPLGNDSIFQDCK